MPTLYRPFYEVLVDGTASAPFSSWVGCSANRIHIGGFCDRSHERDFHLLHDHHGVTIRALQSVMYGLHESTGASILDFVLCYLIQTTIPAFVLVTTPKRSQRRYLTIPDVVWVASRFIRSFAPAGCPTWCQAICLLVLVAIHLMNFLLVHSLDRHNILQVAKNPQSSI